ncbi:MAG: hypothetical protein H0W42_11565 [Gemmatimonadaceae bacterium]|nr:hypothetical protein [Gemmatimonadaceae bacterium]
MTLYKAEMAVDHDEERATATTLAIFGEVVIPMEMVQLRPEHNNALDALRITTNYLLRCELDYDSVDAEITPPK